MFARFADFKRVLLMSFLNSLKASSSVERRTWGQAVTMTVSCLTRRSRCSFLSIIVPYRLVRSSTATISSVPTSSSSTRTLKLLPWEREDAAMVTSDEVCAGFCRLWYSRSDYRGVLHGRMRCAGCFFDSLKINLSKSVCRHLQGSI